MPNTTSEKEEAIYIIRLLESNGSFRKFFVTMLIINVVESVLASSLNVLIILALWKVPSLRKPSNILILNLAVSDFGVGLVLLPMYLSFMVAALNRGFATAGTTYTMFRRASCPLLNVSFFLIFAITVDRFLALSLHLRYKDLVTAKKTSIAAIMIWVGALSWGLPLIFTQPKTTHIMETIDSIVAVFVLILTLFLMLKISRFVNRHSVQLQGHRQAVVLGIDMPDKRKSINTMYYIIGVFAMCYCPYIMVFMVISLAQNNGKGFITAHVFSYTLLMLNSVLDPVIYFWRIQEVRSAVIQLVRAAFCQRKDLNRQSNRQVYI